MARENQGSEQMLQAYSKCCASQVGDQRGARWVIEQPLDSLLFNECLAVNNEHVDR